eukprot:Colp12_sorted_trinity150504_noHs@25168
MHEELEVLRSQVARYTEDQAWMETAKQEIERLTAEKANADAALQQALASKDANVSEVLVKLKESEDHVAELNRNIASQKESEERTHKAFLDQAVKWAESVLERALQVLNDDSNLGNRTATADAVLDEIFAYKTQVDSLLGSFEGDAAYGDAIRDLTLFAQGLYNIAFNTKGVTRLAKDDETVGKIVGSAKQALSKAGGVLSSIRMQAQVGEAGGNLQAGLDALSKFIESLVAATLDLDSNQDFVQQEMDATAQAISEASAHLAALLEKSKAQDTGVTFDVNTSILGSANELMAFIRELVIRATALQQDIVLTSKGNVSTKEFYKKNNRWTEGLVSAAKAVGWGASVLMESADKVVSGTGKFEEMIVAAREIAASTAQLVAASRVKAAHGHELLIRLEEASKDVNSATKSAVNTVKSAAELADNKQEVKKSINSLNQAKRHEMEQQVRVLELENQLAKERSKLLELRKLHYHMAEAAGQPMEN